MSESPRRPFGLVAGLGVGAGIFYYRSLVAEHLARGLTPQILMTHADVRRTMSLAQERKVDELASYLAGLLQQLAAGGCTIATIPAFSPQVCARQLAELTPLPLIGLLETVVAEVERQRYTRVGIFGARVTMETRLFGALSGQAEVIAPAGPDLDFVSTTYSSIVEKESALPHELETLRTLAHKLIDKERLDAILLAGTDWSFVFNSSNTDFPHIDGARIHIQAIMHELAASAPSTAR
ncbi:MAG TPA: aspartate/glutamate racemase family protein [Steroidobacteraceae bacterium]|nr:aspartate/glutamate racemase family protein [Steroidobacteraceae bacterium]